MRIATLLIVFGYFFLTAGFAQVRDFTLIDQQVRQLNAQTKGKSLPEIVKLITGTAKSDVEKARSIYTWIAINIAYDTDYYYNQSQADPCVSVDCVLQNRKSVCAGYAELFHTMTEMAGLTSFVVEGYNKGYGYQTGQRFTRANHAWNVIRLGMQWHLVDVTWGSGHLGSEQQFQFSFNGKYFMTDPEELILTHLPSDPIFQLLESPVPVAVFERGNQAIKSHLDKMPPRLDYDKAIVKYERTPEVERKHRSAVRAYKFNKKNIHDYAFACLAYADALSASGRLRDMKEVSFIKVLDKANTNYQTAKVLFTQLEGDNARHNVNYCDERIQHMAYRMSQLKVLASSR